MYSDESDSDDTTIYDSDAGIEFEKINEETNLLQEVLQNIVVKYSASLMNKKKIPRKYVNDVINETIDLLLQISTVLKQEINKSEFSKLRSIN